MTTTYRGLWVASGVGLMLALAGCESGERVAGAATVRAEAPPALAPRAAERPAAINPRLLRRFKSLESLPPLTDPVESARIELGRQLYYDTRLSRDGDLSCNSCHELTSYGVDHEATSPGHRGARGSRNSPTVFHAAGHIASFWDGRAPDVEAQAPVPILNPKEMAMPDAATAVAALARIPGYVAEFARAFPRAKPSITLEHIGAAIGAFERRLITPGRWDAYLDGDKAALTAEELAGLKAFTDVGCITCHTGEYVGGSMFQKAGLEKAWPDQRDQGRFAVTGRDEDRMVFKVPSLRNVAMTAPYFHDGSVALLADAVRRMGDLQLDLELTDAEIVSITAWLSALTGTLPESYIAEPVLPPDPQL